jgi:hypothetical protein
MWEFGFMLFDPSSTFDSVRENVTFLRQVMNDGSVAATFCKMLPYDGTPIISRCVPCGGWAVSRGHEPGADVNIQRAGYFPIKLIPFVAPAVHGK